MGYLTYYLVWIGISCATAHPQLAVLVVGIWLCRGFLPDPVVWLRTMGRIRRLRTEIALNPSNMTAARELARLYLERKRPRLAIAAIETMRDRMAQSTRHPLGSRDDAELLLILAIAKLAAGDAEQALEPVTAAVAIAPGVGRGEPYIVAANALTKLARWEEAEDALDRYVSINQSSVAAYVKLARVRRKQNDEDGAREAIAQAKSTWGVLPTFLRRKEWRWYLEAVGSPLWL
ncbi:MAG: hypothetical protein NVS3B20_08290 [Polyangiales bacterium]